MSSAETVGYIVLGLATLVALFAQVTKPLLNVTKAITALTTSLENITEKFKAFESKSHDTHKRLWDKAYEHEEMLSDHETRITVAEEKIKNINAGS